MLSELTNYKKRAARIILRADFTTPSAEMFQKLGWISVPSRINYNKAVFTFKALNNLTPAYISDLLKPISQVHSRNLRSSENGSLTLPRANTALFSGSFSCSAPKLWNTFPTTVRLSSSLNAFKKNVREHLLT